MMTDSAQQLETTTPEARQPHHPVEAIFVKRWSPRAFEPQSMPPDVLFSILEAARWAPSAYNIQPWRFIYALRDDARWEDFLALLDPFNARWARNASALLFLVSDTLLPTDEAGSVRPSQTHSFDAGAAWAHLALQATAMGYQAHAMAGIRFDEVRQRLSVPDKYQVEIAIAIGRQADPSDLPFELRKREKPSSRRPLQEIAFPERFPQGTAPMETSEEGDQ